jgi:hypothetical protein
MHFARKESPSAEENAGDVINAAYTLVAAFRPPRTGLPIPESASARVARAVPGISLKKSPAEANHFRFSTSNPVNDAKVTSQARKAFRPSINEAHFHALFTRRNETFFAGIRYIE